MAFLRYKGGYAYLVENERVREGGATRIRQRVLYYFGREVKVDDAVKAAVARRFPKTRVDWAAIATLAKGVTATPRRNRGRLGEAKPLDDEWLSWD